MPRLIPEFPPTEPIEADLGYETRTYHIQLITPMFGGGVDAGTTDPTMPIRATALRGQLQFWWRATCGAAFATLGEMRTRHKEIWGATDLASPVEVSVQNVKAENPVPCASWGLNHKQRWDITWNRPYGEVKYFLFPFQGQGPERGSNEPKKYPACAIPRATFTLSICYPVALKSDVESAVWAWVNFGGLGARTRRGCGSLVCKELAPPNVNKLKEWFGNRGTSQPRPWPVLGLEFLVRENPMEANEAWAGLAWELSTFRQGVGVGRNPGTQSNRPGRSRFPEPETIRELTKADRRRSGHEKQPHMPANAFPRAEFGLPIVFHFQGQGEPDDTTLQPVIAEKVEERMSSPLILKPLALQDGKCVPLVLRLVTQCVERVALMGAPGDPKFGPQAINRPAFATYTNSPMRSSAQGSAIEAFLARLQNDSNYRRITT
jgi:CRISPR-associated protein Cmr1